MSAKRQGEGSSAKGNLPIIEGGAWRRAVPHTPSHRLSAELWARMKEIRMFAVKGGAVPVSPEGAQKSDRDKPGTIADAVGLGAAREARD